MKAKKVSFVVIIIALVLALISLMMAGCTNQVYKQGKPFKPDRSQVTNCHTYYDVGR